MTFTTRLTCRLCSGTTRTVLDLPDVPLANEFANSPDEQQELFPLRIVQCEACGHVQCPIVVDPARLFSGDYAYLSSTAASFRKHVYELVESIASPGQRIVDIGSNDGLLLRAAAARGAVSLGIDPAERLAAAATSEGALTLPAFVTPELAKRVRALMGGTVHIVTALNVFAHADDLGAIADAARELIYPSGAFVFEVAYLLDVLRRNEIGTLYHEHLSHHHVGPLVGFLARHGLTLQSVQRVDSQGGSIRCVARVRGQPDDSVTDALNDEAEIPNLLNQWPARVAAERAALEARIEPYRGRSLAVYGAPARLTVYAYAMGLGPKDVSFVFDDTPGKIGRFTPGLHWPIMAGAGFDQAAKKAVLVAAWPYARELMARHSWYRGEWILPARDG